MSYWLDKCRPVIAERLAIGVKLKMSGRRLRNYIDAGLCFGAGNKHADGVWNTEVTRQLRAVEAVTDTSQGELFGGA